MPSSHRTFLWTYAILALCAALPLWIGEYMPLVDLPQHAAQLAIGSHFRDPALDYAKYYRANDYTNQLVAYGLVRVFALVMPLLPAIKLVLTWAVLGLAGSVALLLASVGTDLWWSLIAFPIAYGVSMYWGLLNYVVALPFGVGLLTLSVRYALQPSRARLWAVLLGANWLFFCHSLVLAYAGVLSVAVIAARAPGLRAKFWGCAALATILPTTAVWWSLISTREASTAPTSFIVAWSALRTGDFFAYQVAGLGDSLRDSLIGATLFLAPFIAGARPARERWRWLPFGLTLLMFAALPLCALDIDMLYGRVSVFALPTFLFALEPVASRPWRRAAVTALVALHLASVTYTFKAFDDEAQPLNTALRAAEPGKRLLFLPTSNQSRVVRHEAYSHFGCFYQIKNGGVVDYSFAELFPAWYRYREGMEPNLPEEFDFNPNEFRFAEHDGERYDYFLVRGRVLPEWFASAPNGMRVLARADDWTLLAPQRALAHTNTPQRH